MHYRLHLAGLLGTLLLMSCVPPMTLPEPTSSVPVQTPWNCAEAVDPKLEAFPFRASEDVVSNWVQEQLGMKLTAIQGGLSADGSGYYQYGWVGQRRYEVSQWVDARDSALVKINWKGPTPTLADVLHCLGEPSLYRAYLAPTPGGSWTYLELWYPKRGLMVTTYITRKATSMTAEQAVAYISYVQPGTPGELIPRFTGGISPGSERYTQIQQGLRPWPGDVSIIIIDERG